MMENLKELRSPLAVEILILQIFFRQTDAWIERGHAVAAEEFGAVGAKDRSAF